MGITLVPLPYKFENHTQAKIELFKRFNNGKLSQKIKTTTKNAQLIKDETIKLLKFKYPHVSLEFISDKYDYYVETDKLASASFSNVLNDFEGSIFSENRRIFDKICEKKCENFELKEVKTIENNEKYEIHYFCPQREDKYIVVFNAHYDERYDANNEIKKVRNGYNLNCIHVPFSCFDRKIFFNSYGSDVLRDNIFSIAKKDFRHYFPDQQVDRILPKYTGLV